MSNNSDNVQFRRELGVFGGISIIGGIMIGSGIFYLGSYVLQRCNMNYGYALLVWILGGIISLLGGLCYAELGVSIPRAGGATVYLSEAFHPVVGFLRGFSDWLIGGPGSVAAMALALLKAISSFLKLYNPAWDLPVEVQKTLASMLIIILTLYNLTGIKRGAFLQNVSMIAKLIPIGIVLFAGLFLGKQSPNLSLFTESTANLSISSILSMIAFATVASLWAYEGWTNLNSMTEEIKNPKRDLPLAIMIGIGSITLLYAIFNYSIFKVLPHDVIVSEIQNGNPYLGTMAAQSVLGPIGSIIVTLGMALAVFNGLNGLIIAQPRAYYAMAVEGHFFKSFAKLHPKYQVPTYPLVVQCIFSIILLWLNDLDQLTSLVVFTGMIFNLLVVLAVPVMRYKKPDIKRDYKVFLYPITVIITALVFLALVVNTYFDDKRNALLGLCVQIIGIILFIIFDKKLKEKK